MKIENYKFFAILSFLIWLIFPAISLLTYKETGTNFTFFSITSLLFIASIVVGFFNTICIIQKDDLKLKAKFLWIIISQNAIIFYVIFKLLKAIA
jgi:hypothetical protein